MGITLVPDQLIEAAMKQTSLSDFGGDSYREGLDLLVSDINRDTRRADDFVGRNQYMIVKALGDRLQVINALNEQPDILKSSVERPVFVFGLPRTGTTLISNLLAADPARRSPLTWELDNPVPPPTTETLFTDPRALAALEAEKNIPSNARAVYRMSAVYPFECVTIMGHDFKTLAQECWGKLPNFRDYLYSTDMTTAYEYHKKWLQLHQSQAPGIWNLKMPSHGLYLETLLKIYPDARLVWTHRDPLSATASYCSIISLGHQNFAGYVDHEWIGENAAFQVVQHGERAMDARERLGDDRIIDLQYADLMRDPMGSVRKLYAQLGDELTPEAEASMQAWLDVNPQGKFGKHEYKLAEYGLTKEGLEPQFERYLSKFNVEREG